MITGWLYWGEPAPQEHSVTPKRRADFFTELERIEQVIAQLLEAERKLQKHKGMR